MDVSPILCIITLCLAAVVSQINYGEIGKPCCRKIAEQFMQNDECEDYDFWFDCDKVIQEMRDEAVKADVKIFGPDEFIAHILCGANQAKIIKKDETIDMELLKMWIHVNVNNAKVRDNICECFSKTTDRKMTIAMTTISNCMLCNCSEGTLRNRLLIMLSCNK